MVVRKIFAVRQDNWTPELSIIASKVMVENIKIHLCCAHVHRDFEFTDSQNQQKKLFNVGSLRQRLIVIDMQHTQT